MPQTVIQVSFKFSPVLEFWSGDLGHLPHAVELLLARLLLGPGTAAFAHVAGVGKDPKHPSMECLGFLN